MHSTRNLLAKYANLLRMWILRAPTHNSLTVGENFRTTKGVFEYTLQNYNGVNSTRNATYSNSPLSYCDVLDSGCNHYKTLTSSQRPDRCRRIHAHLIGKSRQLDVAYNSGKSDLQLSMASSNDFFLHLLTGPYPVIHQLSYGSPERKQFRGI